MVDEFNLLIRASGGVGIGTNAPAQQLHVAGNVQVDDTLSASAISTGSGGLQMGRIYLTGDGTILTTDGGQRQLIWDKTNDEIELTNTTGDWCDYWWRAQKGGTATGSSGATAPSSSNVVIISGTATNTWGFEVHFGQADGAAGQEPAASKRRQSITKALTKFWAKSL